MNTKLDDFTLAYLECALWSSYDNDQMPLDQNYGLDDFAPEAIDKAIEDCKDFQVNNSWRRAYRRRRRRRPSSNGSATSGGSLGYSDAELAGHDFWLTRNHHGAGFWDRQLDNGEELADAAHAYGECCAYVGDDGKIYLS